MIILIHIEKYNNNSTVSCHLCINIPLVLLIDTPVKVFEAVVATDETGTTVYDDDDCRDTDFMVLEFF